MNDRRKDAFLRFWLNALNWSLKWNVLLIQFNCSLLVALLLLSYFTQENQTICFLLIQILDILQLSISLKKALFNNLYRWFLLFSLYFPFIHLFLPTKNFPFQFGRPDNAVCVCLCVYTFRTRYIVVYSRSAKMKLSSGQGGGERPSKIGPQ